jgi:hypothetical protein
MASIAIAIVSVKQAPNRIVVGAKVILIFSHDAKV